MGTNAKKWETLETYKKLRRSSVTNSASGKTRLNSEVSEWTWVKLLPKDLHCLLPRLESSDVQLYTFSLSLQKNKGSLKLPLLYSNIVMESRPITNTVPIATEDGETPLPFEI